MTLQKQVFLKVLLAPAWDHNFHDGPASWLDNAISQPGGSKAPYLAKGTLPWRTDEEDSNLGDFIEDKNALMPLDQAIGSNLRESTTKILATLTIDIFFTNMLKNKG